MSSTLDLPVARFLHTLETVAKIETLNRAERLGVLPSTERWLEVRNLRNRLVHEYMTDPVKFARDLELAKEYSLMLIETFNCLRQYAMMRMGHKKENLPEELTLPGQSKGTSYEEN